MSIPTNLGNKTPEQIVNELIYQSFATNRDEGMSADAYGKLLRMDVSQYEIRYQLETMP